MSYAKNVKAKTTIITASALAAVLFSASFVQTASAEYLANAMTVTTFKNQPVTFFISGSAPQEFFYQIKTAPVNGYLEYDGATGQVWYTPNANFTGTDSFTFRTVATMNTHWFGQQALVTINVIEEENQQNTDNNNNNSPTLDNDGRFRHLRMIMQKLSVYKNHEIPAVNLSGYDLGNGNSVSTYTSLSDSHANPTMTMQAWFWLGEEVPAWDSLSEAQQTFLIIAVEAGVNLDSNGNAI